MKRVLCALALMPLPALADAPDSYSAPVAATYSDSNHLQGYRPGRISEWPVAEAADEDALIRDLQDAFAARDEPPASLLISRRDGRLVIDVEQTGFADDSVSGKRMRGVFVEDGDGLRLYETGTQFQCARGANAGVFGDQLCP